MQAGCPRHGTFPRRVAAQRKAECRTRPASLPAWSRGTCERLLKYRHKERCERCDGGVERKVVRKVEVETKRRSKWKEEEERRVEHLSHPPHTRPWVINFRDKQNGWQRNAQSPVTMRKRGSHVEKRHTISWLRFPTIPGWLLQARLGRHDVSSLPYPELSMAQIMSTPMVVKRGIDSGTHRLDSYAYT